MSAGPDRNREAAVLRERIAELERELAVSREALRRVEADAQPSAVVVQAAPDNEASSINVTSSGAAKLALFRARFAGRDDMYALRWVSRRTGKPGWSPAVKGGYYTDDVTNADLLRLSDGVMEHHLTGDPHAEREFHVGLYPMLPGDRCRLLVCDFDDGEWRDDAAAYAAACGRAGIDALTEISRSGEGAHVWVFFDEPVSATAARAMGATLLRAAMTHRASMALSSYDRFFPSQDTLPERSPGRLRFGNLIALPLQGDCRRRGTTVFADPATWAPFPDQFAALAAIRPVPMAVLEGFATASSRPRAGPQEQLAPRPRRSTIRVGARRASGRRVELRRDAVVHVPLDGLPGAVVTELKHLASVSNPEFYRRQAQRLSTFGIPRLVTCFEHDETELRIPRGLCDEAESLLTDAGFVVEVRTDSPASGRIDLRFEGELRDEQQAAVNAMLAHDTGVLVAPPGAGKTVMACGVIAERNVSTAILVNRAELLQQWRTRLTQFLSLTGKQIGQLGGGRRKRRGVVDLIMMQSIAHRNGDPSILEEYGQVIVDECHAIAAPAAEAAIRGVNVRHWVGLTATPYRADKMDGLITMECGPIRHTIAASSTTDRHLIVHNTAFETDEPGTEIQAIYTELVADAGRNELIVSEVISAVSGGRRCLVLTSRLDHLDVLVRHIRERTDAPVLALHGRLPPAERRVLRERINDLGTSADPFVLVAIDKVAGEGIDLPSLNTLFLTVPVSFKGRVIQQIGRVTRGDTQADAIVHDFRDSAVPTLENMHHRRRRVMTKEGFTLTR